MTHKDDLKYKDEYLEDPKLEEAQWTGVFKGDGYADANGPCPACGGTAYGPPLPTIAKRQTRADEGAAADGADLAVDVPCSCSCGEDHGGGADAGCGRWWIYRVEKGFPNRGAVA